MTIALFRTCARMAVALVLCLSPAALAQSAEDILNASREAIAEIPGFEAQFRLQGEGSSMFADTLPSMSGKLFFGTHDEYGPVIHAIGEGKDKKTDPSKPIDLLIARDRFIWVDREQQVINEAPRQSTVRGAPSALTLVFIDTLLNEDPYAQDAGEAQSITLGSQEEINGELCDQVIIKRKKPGPRARGADSYTDVAWWISTSDKLPRKVLRITDAGMVKLTLNFEMSNLEVTDPEQQRLDVNRPASFRFVSRMPNAQPQKPAVPDEPLDRGPSDRGAEDTAPETANPADPGAPRAPSFSFETSEGALINNSSQIDRVSVLYFWGSWCAPCTETSPLVETMASEIDDPSLDVFALAIREGEPRQALSDFRQDFPTPRVSVNPEGVTNAFKVRVFPSVVVLDRAGSIVFQRSIERGFGPEALIEAARQAVNEALGES